VVFFVLGIIKNLFILAVPIEFLNYPSSSWLPLRLAVIHFSFMQNIIEFVFDNKVVEFDVSGTDVMVNATEMGKVFGKEPYDFLKLEGTQRFIEALKRPNQQNRSDYKSERLAENGILTDEMVYRTEVGGPEGGGTWMVRPLALKFAAWLDPDFEVWVYRTIDDLIFKYSRANNSKLMTKTQLLEKRARLVTILVDNSDFREYLDNEKKIKQIDNQISKNNLSQMDLFRNQN
jgi:hypothetical protein